MAISNISPTPATSSVKAITSNAFSSGASKAKSTDYQQDGSVVTLSAQARKLSMAQGAPEQTQTTQTQTSTQADKMATAKVEAGAREAAEAPLARIKENELRARASVNTYA